MPKEKCKIQTHYIYKIVFLQGFPSGRYYIGKRSYNGVDISKDKYRGSGKFCKSYFKKYGAIYGVTYLKEILEINPDKEINKIREFKIIGNLWKTDPLCMNEKCGGDGGATSYGRKITEENKLKLIKSKQKAVYQFDLKGNLINKYDSIKTAAKITKSCQTKISDCCKKKRFTCNGFIWRYNNYVSKEDLDLINKDFRFKSCDRRAVYRIDSNNKIKYTSVREAARINGIANSSIHAVCSGKRKRAGGYFWKFAD